MASFEYDRRLGNYHVRFRYGGKPFKRSLRLADDREADRVCGVVEETLKDLQRSRLELPEGADPGAFLISGGKVSRKPNSLVQPEAPAGPTNATIGTVFDTYAKPLTAGSKESSSIEKDRA
jgi:hypothetical protein